MAVVVGEAAVRLRPAAEGFAAEAEADIDGGLPAVAKKAAGYFAAAFAAVKVGEFLKDSVVQASDLSESASKVGVVFGDAAGQVQKFAEHAASQMGMSRQQALEAAGTFGNLGVSLGLSQSKTADMSTSLVKLAGDLASFNNVDPAEALDALRSGLTGETEPLKRFGININDATLKQQALKMGLDASGPTLDAATKAQASYALIMAQSTTAQGDFARTSGGLANQQRIIAAQFLDLKANIGAGFLPFVNLAARGISAGLMPALLSATAPIASFGQAVGGMGTGLHAAFTGNEEEVGKYLNQLHGVNYAVGLLATTTGAYGHTFREAFHGGDVTGAQTAGGLLGLIANMGQLTNYTQAYGYTFMEAFHNADAGVAGTETGLVGFLARTGEATAVNVATMQESWGRLRHSVEDAWNGPVESGVRAGLGRIGGAIESAAAPIMGRARAAFAAHSGGFESTFGGLADRMVLGMGALTPLINNVANAVGPAVSGLIDRVAGLFSQVAPVVMQTLGTLLPVVGNLFQQLVPVVMQIIPVVMQVAGIWQTVFREALVALLPVIPPLVAAIGQLVSQLVTGLVPIISALAPLISTLVTMFETQLVGVISALVPLIPPLIAAFAQIAGVIANVLLSALGALLPILPSLMQVLTGVASAISGALLGALQALTPILPPLMAAFAEIAGVVANVLMAALSALLPVLPPLLAAFGQIAAALAGALLAAFQALVPVIPILLDALMLLIQAAVVPLMPLIGMLAGLIGPLASIFITLVMAVIPLLPVAAQLIALLVTLAMDALIPLMPIIGLVVNVVVALVGVLAEVIGVALSALNVFFTFGAGLVGVVVSAVTQVIGFFQMLAGWVGAIFSGISSTIIGVWSGIFGFVNWIVGAIGDRIIGAFSWVAGAIGGMFSGIGGVVSDVFGGAVDIIRGQVNGIIGLINGAIGFINDTLIDTANRIPFVSLPHIPYVPRLHSGGEFMSGSPAGEGLALLRDRELVATPEQRVVADDLLRSLLSGQLPAPAGSSSTVNHGATSIVNNITQLPGESGAVFAARASDRIARNLGSGITRPVGG